VVRRSLLEISNRFDLGVHQIVHQIFASYALGSDGGWWGTYDEARPAMAFRNILFERLRAISSFVRRIKCRLQIFFDLSSKSRIQIADRTGFASVTPTPAREVLALGLERLNESEVVAFNVCASNFR
jgi:hypothetical protein